MAVAAVEDGSRGITGDSVISPVVVAPTYNNAGTLLDILGRLDRLGLAVIVVNDGSTDDSPRLLEGWLEQERGQQAHVITHPANRGKAAAMMSGFRAAWGLGHTHAVTIDTDGQLDPEQIPAMLAIARESPQALVLGVRDDRADDYPRRSRLGRRLSNLAIRLECGRAVQDSQCGLRVYPLAVILRIRCKAGRYGYEPEVVTRAVWAGCSIREIPVRCRYLPVGQRVSHFRVGRDSWHHLRLHVRMLFRASLPWPHRRLGSGPAAQTTWRDVLNWASPRELWRQLRSESQDSSMVAASVALGVFIANLPIYGLQGILSVYLARKLHLHPLPALVGSHFSTPPVGPVLIFAAIWLGHLILTGSPLSLAELTHANVAAMAGRLLLEWTLGGILFGAFFGALAFAGVNLLVRRLPRPGEETIPATVRFEFTNQTKALAGLPSVGGDVVFSDDAEPSPVPDATHSG